ncbi:hypothetical protein OH686_07295 [Pseudomonas sp. SO81]|nr:hypothetical protein OH686_07295 [Pseudomonas sp. SO81]
MLAGLLILIVLLSYIFQFYYRLDYAVSSNPEHWGQLGDYIGGTLNPLLSFISIILLIQSLTLQTEANKGLRVEVELTRKTEKLRSFEMQLFNMLESQRAYFDSFTAYSKSSNTRLSGSAVVIKIEDTVEILRSSNTDPAAVTKYLEQLDSTDKIYGLTRIFCNMVRIIEEKLSNSNGFNEEDRRSHYLTLINFTDFSLLRLIMMCVQFIDNASNDYLKKNAEFNLVLEDVGLSFNLY